MITEEDIERCREETQPEEKTKPKSPPPWLWLWWYALMGRWK